MSEQLFTSLSRLTEQGAAWTAAAAFGWGIFSILLSPCHLASIPLVVAYVNRGQITNTRRAFALSALFSLGIFLSTAAIGIITVEHALDAVTVICTQQVADRQLLFGMVTVEFAV